MGIKQYKKGSAFEQEFAEMLSNKGFWSTVLSKQRDGSQPFDVQAQKGGLAYNFDCKTLEKLLFPLNRIEENQENSFRKLCTCGCYENYFAIKTVEGVVYICDAEYLIKLKHAGSKNISPRVIGITFDDWVKNLERQG